MLLREMEEREDRVTFGHAELRFGDRIYIMCLGKCGNCFSDTATLSSSQLP